MTATSKTQSRENAVAKDFTGRSCEKALQRDNKDKNSQALPLDNSLRQRRGGAGVTSQGASLNLTS